MDRKLLNDLFAAYFDARRNKRKSVNQLKFEQDLETNIVNLAIDIEKHRYKVEQSICFIIHKPVIREVFAADFRDRVVHHYIYNAIAPMLERSFIEDCYSCRKGYGTTYGIKRLRHHIRSCSHNFTKEAYVMKLDLAGYFMSINRNKFLETVKNEMQRYKINNVGKES